MNAELRERIIKSNKCTLELEKEGYKLQGITKDFLKVAVFKNDEIFYFKNYIEAHEKLILKN